jgi:hypothetical protein
MANHGDYVNFIFVAPKNRSFSFRTYNNEKGQTVGFAEGFDKDNRPLFRRWKFDQDTRMIRVHKGKEDEKGVNAVQFLKNSPNCQGSVNGTYLPDGTQLEVYFKEMNEEKDAKAGLEIELLRLEAQNAALKVKGQDFIDLCALIGVFNKDESVMRFSLIDYAKNKPESFLDIYKDPIRQLKSLVRRAVHENVFQKDGRMYLWENTLIGSDEDEAVQKLKMDDNLLKAVKTHLEKLK